MVSKVRTNLLKIVMELFFFGWKNPCICSFFQEICCALKRTRPGNIAVINLGGYQILIAFCASRQFEEQGIACRRKVIGRISHLDRHAVTQHLNRARRRRIEISM